MRRPPRSTRPDTLLPFPTLFRSLRGCDPKKLLVAAAEALDLPRRLAGKGARHAELAVDWPALMAFKRGFTEPVPESREASFAELGIAGYHGRARLAGRDTVAVGDDVLKARHILLAAGAAPMKLGIAGEEHLATSDGFLELATLPRPPALAGGERQSGGWG